MSTGDVAGAFRNIPVAAEAAGRFSGTIPELGILVVDLACPFGWTDSPRQYWAAGGAIVHLHKNTAPTWSGQPSMGSDKYDGKAWCDDHICIEPNIGSRLMEASISLRSAMVTILGPNACNEEKFTPWFTEGKALGLHWNLNLMTLSMPEDKITKALQRLSDLQAAQTASKNATKQVTGKSKARGHVCAFGRTIFPADRVICSNNYSVSPFFGLSRFVNAKDPDHHIHMDASDRGLCALWPARKEYLQLEFDADELQQIADFNGLTSDEFSINIRELMSAVFAAIVWASQWSQSGQVEQAHTRFWIDNTSAVAWANRRSSRNLFAQMLLRLIGFLEVRYNFYSSAAHIPGAENVMADVGSRDTTELKKTLHTLSALLRAGALADTSRVQYRRSWDQWLRWCSFMDYTPWLGRDTVDANAAQLGAFAVYLWRYGMNRAGVGNTCTTICSKLCAVRWFHKNTAGYDPSANAGHAILLRGIRRLTDSVVKQQSVTPSLLRKVFLLVDVQHARGQLLWGGLLLAFFFLLRRSEYLFIGRKHHRYALRLGDIVFRNEAGQHVSPRQAEVVGIRLSGAKNNQLDVKSCDFTAAQEIKYCAQLKLHVGYLEGHVHSPHSPSNRRCQQGSARELLRKRWQTLSSKLQVRWVWMLGCILPTQSVLEVLRS
ncbi:hypothetical protein F443_01689 [Phytophthora nicotianae P1569]|uniref:Uncharacterized protein n=1 Tax=Phytophthora nicotianae P1569 TaxID=1317065 RepID=V9FXY5_PHYNI|nr:hypothetical protein F443_01689 [Phytophthora nicotianae P1569]